MLQCGGANPGHLREFLGKATVGAVLQIFHAKVMCGNSNVSNMSLTLYREWSVFPPMVASFHLSELSAQCLGDPVTSTNRSFFQRKSWILQYECRFHFPTWDVGRENVPKTTSRRVEFTAMNGQNAEDGALPLWKRYLDFLRGAFYTKEFCNLIYPKLLIWVARWVDWLVKNHVFAEWRCEDVRSCERQDRVVQCRWMGWWQLWRLWRCADLRVWRQWETKEATLACSDSCH